MVPLVLLLGVGWLCTRVPFLRTSLLVLTDSLAHAFQWLGVTEPGPAWLLLGVVGGALLGVLVGLWRAGRPVSARVARRGAAVVGVGMLVAGSVPPSGAAVGWGDLARRTRASASEPNASPASTPRSRVAGRPRRPTAAQAPEQTTISGGNVEAPGVGGGVGAAGDAVVGDATALDSAPQPAATRGGARVRPSVPLADGAGTGGDRAAVDRAAVSDVQAQLAEARTSASAGDYAAALRVLAAADEGVALATAKYGDQAWVAALRREAAGTRGAVRFACESAVALAGRRGVAAPVCD